MINKISIFMFLTVLLFGCQKDIEDYFYKDTEEFVDMDILSLLKEKSEYSQFVALLEEYKVDTILDKGKVYTFFVPDNDAMDNMEQGTLGNKELIEYLMTESFLNLNQIKDHSKIQTLGEKFAYIQAVGDSIYTIDGVEILSGSPLANNGRYYEIAEVVQPKPSLYQYIAATNEFYRAFLDSQDSIYLDKELSTPIGYTEDGLTVYDTVLTTVNLFEENYFPVSEEFRDNKATMLLFSQEQYDAAISTVASDLALPLDGVTDIWQNEILMPYMIEQSVFRNALPYSAFSIGKARNILGDSVFVAPEEIIPEYFECSNGRAYNFSDFEVPDFLYKVMDTVPMASLLSPKGSGLYAWNEEVEVAGQGFPPFRGDNTFATFDEKTLLIDMGRDFNGDFSFAYKHENVFPGKYLLIVRVNFSKTGVFNIYVNDKKFGVSNYYWSGYKEDVDFFELKKDGVWSMVTNTYYPVENNFCTFEVLVDNITEYGDVEVKLDYVSPSAINSDNCGINIDFIALDYYSN